MGQPGRDLAAVILDMDGLMFDTERIAVDAWMRAGADCGCPIPESVIVETVGLDARSARSYLERALGPSFDYDRVRPLRLRYGAETIERQGVPVKPGLAELLDVLANRGVPRAVATSTDRARTESLLSKAHLMDQFDVVVCGDEVEHGKPAPEIFLRAAERLHASPPRCVVLEDSEMGIRAASNAGMRAFLVPDLKTPGPQTVALADRVFPSLHGVASFFSEAFAAQG
jgi:HAD superfamily hydrolase (TIGR01509 family)